MKRILISAVAVAILGFGLFRVIRKAKEPADLPAERTVTVQSGRIEETVEATGEVVALNRVEIRPPISGRIEKLLFDEGAAVKEGQILAWMSSSDRAAIIDAARAKGPEELKRWEDTYKPTPIVAPLSGVVIRRNVVVGQTVGTSDDLFAMADKLIVMTNVDETDIGRARVGMPARIRLDAYPDKPVEGRVFNLRYEGRNVSNVITYGVKVELNSVPSFFRSQMTANVSLVVKAKERAVLVPASAVSEDRSGAKQVFVPGPDGKPAAKTVVTGSENGESVEIIEGLQSGDEVIIVRARYTPQRPIVSPLVLGGSPRGGEPAQGRGGRRQGSRSQ